MKNIAKNIIITLVIIGFVIFLANVKIKPFAVLGSLNVGEWTPISADKNTIVIPFDFVFKHGYDAYWYERPVNLNSPNSVISKADCTFGNTGDRGTDCFPGWSIIGNKPYTSTIKCSYQGQNVPVSVTYNETGGSISIDSSTTADGVACVGVVTVYLNNNYPITSNPIPQQNNYPPLNQNKYDPNHNCALGSDGTNSYESCVAVVNALKNGSPLNPVIISQNPSKTTTYLTFGVLLILIASLGAYVWKRNQRR